MEDHPISADLLDRFVSFSTTAPERKAVVSHLLSGCRRCQAYLRRYWAHVPVPHKVTSITAPSYDQVFERVARRLSSPPDSEIDHLLDWLERQPLERQILLVRNHPRFWRVDLCDSLISRSHELRFRDAAQMLHIARLATIVWEHLEETPRDRNLSAWGAFGNALRVSGDLEAAREEFAKMQAYLEDNRATAPLIARSLSQLASLHFDQRRFSSSLSLSQQAIDLWRKLRQPDELARSLIKQAMALGETGRPEEALRVLKDARFLVDRADDQGLALIVLHNQARFFAAMGLSKEALCLHDEAGPLYREIDGPLIRIKRLWLQGLILVAEDDLVAAAESLFEVRESFLERGNTYEAALAALDLAKILLKLGRRSETILLSLEALQEMESLRIYREVATCNTILEQAAAGSVPQ